MKKIFVWGFAIAAVAVLASCNKENAIEISDTIVVKASTENVNDPSTRVSISESGSKFYLNWEGTEKFGVANSTNTNDNKNWTVDSFEGREAQITGALPKIEDAETTNYIVATNYFSSTNTVIRANIPANQSFNGDNIAQNCLLIARSDNATVGELSSVDFKTMNGFLKFSLKKGSAASGSTNSYTKMYVQSIIVEALGEENIAGRFEISKTDDNWTEQYSGTVSGQMSSKVTLDCTSVNATGEELTSSAKSFYVAIAFGTYASGLKVTINVNNEEGKSGSFTKTFGSSGVTIARNSMRSLSALTVNPEDAETPDTYTCIEDPSAIEAGTYYLAAKNGDKYYLWTGAMSNSKDLATAEYTYNSNTKVLSGDGAVEVTLVSTSGGFYVKNGTKYLRAKSAANRTLACDTTTDVWSFGVSMNSENQSRGGLKMTEANYSTTLVSANTTSAVLRNYTSATNGNFGVYLFKKD